LSQKNPIIYISETGADGVDMIDQKLKQAYAFSQGAIEKCVEGDSPWLSVILKSQNQKILDLLKPKLADSVLECGCGNGDLLVDLASPNRFICGHDISKGSLHIAKMINPTAHLILADGENLPLRNQSFESVVIKGALHHFPNIPLALKEIKRVLYENGILILSEPCGDTHFIRSMRNSLSKEKEKYFRTEELLHLLWWAGFRSIRVIRIDYAAFALGVFFGKTLAQFKKPAPLWRGLSRLMLFTDKVFLLSFLRKYNLGLIIECRK
jgi:SAM-dependent methyltransferase